MSAGILAPSTHKAPSTAWATAVSRSQRLVLLVAISLAVLVELGGAIGWWSWIKLREELVADPAAAADRLVHDPLLALPPALVLLRDLSGNELAKAPLDRVMLGLLRIGRLQERWMPADPKGPLNRATAHLLIGDLAGGRQALEQALRLSPTSAELHRYMARAQRWGGYPREALEHVADAWAISPDRNELPIELTPEDEEWARLEALQRRLDLYPRRRVAALLDLALEYRKSGRHQEVPALLETVSTEPEVQLQLVRWSIDDGQIGPQELARTEEIAGRRSYPIKIRVRAWSLVAQARDITGDHEGALAAADEAVRLGPGSPTPYKVLAAMAERRGDHAAVLKNLRRAWGMAPTDVDLLLWFAHAAERCGELSDARITLQRAAELDTTRPVVATRLISFHMRRGNYLEASQLLTRFLELHPEDPQLLALAQLLLHETRNLP